MSNRGRGPGRHSGRTPSGNTRDVKVKRIGNVTIYRRGKSYSIYYRENGKSIRRTIDGNLAVAEATAGKIVQSLAEQRATEFAYERVSPRVLVTQFLDYGETVRKHSIGTIERYRSALELFVRFCEESNVKWLENIAERTVDDLVRWLRTQKRNRNGSKAGKKAGYMASGIEYILSTCRTAFNWARRRKLYPPYHENPFSQIGKDTLKEDDQDEGEIVIFSPDQEQAFFAACDEWQKGLFITLAAYGMRVGELTHLLVEDVDFDAQVIRIRSKPDLFWGVKSRRRREIPITPTIESILRERIGRRKAGFVFLARPFYDGKRSLPEYCTSPESFRRYFEQELQRFTAKSPEAKRKEQRNHIFKVCRQAGWTPTTRLREEFMTLTEQIGCPDFTRAHNLRHLFISRSQEAGTNVFLVADVVGQTSIETTRRYTHLGMKAKRDALIRLVEGTVEKSDESKQKTKSDPAA